MFRAPAVVCLALAPALVGCHSQKHVDREKAAAPPAAKAAPAGSAAPVPDLRPGPPSEPSPLTADRLWRQAAGGAAIDLQRLATREGAAGLMQGVDAGGTLALTALRALPDAQDAELALPRLCRILGDAGAGQVGPVLDAVQAVIAQPPRPVEALDPEGMRSCAPVLEKLEKDAELTPHERDLAASARSMLAERL